MIKDYFFLVLKNFERRKLRGMLTILGIFIGIMAIVALISLTQGMQDSITDQFQKLGTNRITVTAGGVSLGPVGSELTTAKLSDKDVKTISEVSGVNEVVGILMQTARIDFNRQVKYQSVAGVPTDSESRKVIDEISFFQIDSGRSVRNGDKYNADLGYNFGDDLFDKSMRVGNNFQIEKQDFEVVGVRKKAGTGIHDSIIKIPMDSARELFNEPDKLSMIFVVTSENADVGKIAEEIKKDLRKSRDVEEGEEDFTVQTAEQSVDMLNQILSIVQIILVGIAAVSLIVGGIGIMNTMYTSVMERTREIGIMKALGAKGSQIRDLFLVESGTIGLVGGTIGIVLGLLIGKVAQFIADLYGIALIPHISFMVIIGVLAFSFIIGSVSGVFPAMQASKLKPIDAIRGH
ncbi:MAG: ABC transporter permease [Nanoarchaeota archaeon]|nr:ABC transporter permease [Nanoarchaeota archaeon]